jgi:hypothetical protein
MLANRSIALGVTNMVDPSKFFKHGRATCPKCGQINDLGSSEALYDASLATPCIHCGFLFLDHIDRQMKKLIEMTAKDPQWGELLRSGRLDVIKQRLDELVPLPEETAMTEEPRKMSEIMKEMSETLLRNSGGVPSSEAAHVALLFANIAWNESVGLDHTKEGYRNVWETIVAENPALWNEFKSNDINAMIDELTRYKRTHYPNDRRRILVCGMVPGKIHVEWLKPAAAGVDSKWEMQLYGLVRTGEKDKAIRFLQDSRRMTRREAAKRIKQVTAELGMK